MQVKTASCWQAVSCSVHVTQSAAQLLRSSNPGGSEMLAPIILSACDRVVVSLQPSSMCFVMRPPRWFLEPPEPSLANGIFTYFDVDRHGFGILLMLTNKVFRSCCSSASINVLLLALHLQRACLSGQGG